MNKVLTRPSHFTPSDESLMRRVGERFAQIGLVMERSAGPVDYYRVIPEAAAGDDPAWIVARHYDGTYHLYTGRLEPVRAAASLCDVLPPDWVAA